MAITLLCREELKLLPIQEGDDRVLVTLQLLARRESCTLGEREREGETLHWYIELVFIRRSSFARYTYNIVLHHWFSAQQELYLHPGIFQKNVFTVHKLCFR